jgi:DNA repair protein RecN (Recombination protein N)
MLTELRVENFAIIDQLELQFSPGLITFTGETGAGKSIILGALETILGGRADSTLIRSGVERANVEATFFLPESARQAINALLENEGLLDDPDQLTLGREIRRSGRNVARINGRSVGVSLLREVGEYLVDIHGQSEHLSLLRVSQHLGLLDRYADTEELLKPYQQIYRQLQAAQKQLETLHKSERDAARRADLLVYQIDEIESAHLKAGEEQELREERNRLANAEGLASLSQSALQLLDEGTPESPVVSDLLGSVVESLAQIARLDPAQANLAAQAESIFETISELSLSLRAYLESIEFNPKRLEQVEERLGLIHNLKRKYGDTIEAVNAFAANAQKELDAINHAEERIAELEAEIQSLYPQLAERGLALSQKRRASAAELQRAVENELNDLRMAGARFQVDFQRRPEPQGVSLPDGERVAFDASGLERIEFLVETNPGEGFKPLV